MGIAAKYHGEFVAFAQTQYLQIVVSCRGFIAYRFERTVVDLKKCVMLLCGTYYRLKFKVGGAVAGMAYDVDERVRYRLYHSGGVFLTCAPAVA